MNEEEIFQSVIKKLSKNYILNRAYQDKENPFGVVITYIRDYYNTPKTKGWNIAKRVCDYYKLKPIYN